MDIKRHRPEEIVTKLRQVEVLVGQGLARIDAIRDVQITEQTFYRWRKQYGGMGTAQLKELKCLQKENERLRRAVSDLTLEKLILSEPRTSSGLHQPGAQQAECIRAIDLPYPWSASVNTEATAKRPCR
jgi:putative transposase